MLPISCFIWETGESGDINVFWKKTLNCYPNYTNGLYSENNLSNTKPNKRARPHLQRRLVNVTRPDRMVS